MTPFDTSPSQGFGFFKRSLDARRKLLLAMMLIAQPALAQSGLQEEQVSAVKLLAGNIAIGSITAGMAGVFTGKSSWRDFAFGAIGGAATYAGKVIISKQTPLASWTGRQLAATGSSVIANVASDQHPFYQFVAPIGPLRLHIQSARPLHPRVKVDVATTVLSIYHYQRKATSLDLAASLGNGGIIFADRATKLVGAEGAGVILIAHASGDRTKLPMRVLAHELIHASQYDFVSIVYAERVERWLGGAIPQGRRITRSFDFGTGELALVLANRFIDVDDRPWEIEARRLAPGR